MGAPSSAAADLAAKNIGQSNVSTLQAFQGSRVLPRGECSYTVMGDELIATDTATGDDIWTKKIEGDLAGSGGFLATTPVAAGGELIIGTLDGRILRIDPTTGKEIASYTIGHGIRAQPAVMDGHIYITTTDGHLIAIDTNTPTLTGWLTWGGNAAHTGIPATP